MRSLYDDILATLTSHVYTIPNVAVRKPYDETAKTYPMLVLHEIDNAPFNHSTMNGESRTVLAYQIDILTHDCLDSTNATLSRWDAAKRLRGEVVDLLSTTHKLTRRTVTDPEAISADVVEAKVRGECVLDSYGYAYRP